MLREGRIINPDKLKDKWVVQCPRLKFAQVMDCRNNFRYFKGWYDIGNIKCEWEEKEDG